MKQKITQMRLGRYLFTVLLTLLFVSCGKGRSSDEPKPNNGEQNTSSKQVEEEIGFGQREVTLQVGGTAKVTLHGVRSPRIEISNSNLVEATLVEQGKAVSLKGLQAGEGTIRVFSSNRYAELRVIVKANVEDSNNPFNGKNIVGDKISSEDYELSADGLALIRWKNPSTQNLDMNRDSRLRKITSIRDMAFQYRNLTNVTIPSSVTSIGKRAFLFCDRLTSVTIPSSVKSIGYEAFSYCSRLTSVTLPSSVTSIGHYAFSYCSSLMSVTIPSSVTSIGVDAFSGCSSLTSVTIPGSVTSIGWGAFRGCSSLTSIHIPSSVTSIGGGAFGGCSSLTSVNIPSSVTSIENGAFRGCSSLTKITIPGSVTSIGEDAFSGCSSLTSVTIPSSVTSIEFGAFSGCSSLKSVTIPNSVASIGRWAFSGCSSLTSITIPSSVTSIGLRAFSGCSSLTSITIPSSVTSIEGAAFRDCSSLTRVVFKGNKPPKKEYYGYPIFSDTPGSLKLIVPKGAKEAYIKAEYPADKLVEE